MSYPQGLLSYPGIKQQTGNWSMTLSHGITPSVATLTAVPQVDAIPPIGTLKISYGGETISFPSARVVSYRPGLGLDGQSVQIAIQDRRWRWKYGRIDGRYNIRRPDGTIEPDTEKTPRELLALLFDAEKEQGYDLSRVPNVTRPYVDWVAANPMQAAADLCDDLSCRIVLGLDNRVRVWPVGVGSQLPAGGTRSDAAAILALPERPDSVFVAGGPALFESEWALEAVGLDIDGSVKPIDDLTYKPSGGWIVDKNPALFLSVADQDKRNRAIKSVYRWYRITKQAHQDESPGPVPGYDGPVEHLWQVLPIRDVLTTTYAGPDGERQPRAAEVTGVYWPPGSPEYTNTEAGTLVVGSDGRDLVARINTAEGIVEFSQPVYRFSDDKDLLAADLVLKTSYPVRDLETRQEIRYGYERPISGQPLGTGPHVVYRDDLVLTTRATYDDDGNLTGTVTNKATIDAESNKQAIEAAKEFTVEVGEDVTYSSIVRIEPDGAIQQVAWAGGLGGATTRASRNVEFSSIVPPYRRRRQQERQQRRKPGGGS